MKGVGLALGNEKGEVKTEYGELLKIMEKEIKHNSTQQREQKEKKSPRERNGIKDTRRDHKRKKNGTRKTQRRSPPDKVPKPERPTDKKSPEKK